jgi:hypothetical protein
MEMDKLYDLDKIIEKGGTFEKLMKIEKVIRLG